MTRWKRDLSRLDGVLRVEVTNGSHLRLRLTNGSTVFTALTPSDWRTLANTQKKIKHALAGHTPWGQAS